MLDDRTGRPKPEGQNACLRIRVPSVQEKVHRGEADRWVRPEEGSLPQVQEQECRSAVERRVCQDFQEELAGVGGTPGLRLPAPGAGGEEGRSGGRWCRLRGDGINGRDNRGLP